MGRSGGAGNLKNRVREHRESARLSQLELSRLAGLTRQAVVAIESGRYIPNTLVALKLARALDRRVEDLFEAAPPSIPIPPNSSPVTIGRADLARVGSRLVQLSIERDHMLADGFQPADAIVDENGSANLFIPPALVDRTAIIVGCDPSLAILAAHVSRRSPDVRVLWQQGSSKDALRAIDSGSAHIAGLHLRDAKTGEFNVLGKQHKNVGSRVVVAYAVWEQGFMVAPGNPLNLTSSVDVLAQTSTRFINREKGSGSRALLDQLMAGQGITQDLVHGYESTATSHMAVARKVAGGTADAGVGLRAVATSCGLDFVPLAHAEFDFVIPDEHLRHPAVIAVLECLQSPQLRAELAALPGYDVTHTGSIRRRVGHAA